MARQSVSTIRVAMTAAAAAFAAHALVQAEGALDARIDALEARK
jgi:hypothetical protein